MTVSADQIARALISEARKSGIDPVRVFEPANNFVRVKVARVQPDWCRFLDVAPEAAA